MRPESRPAAAAALAALLLVATPALAERGAPPWEAHLEAAERARLEGRTDDARAALEAAIAEAEVPGRGRMGLARSLEALADLERDAGRDAAAERLYLRAIAGWERVLGADQPRVGIPLHNLAVLYLGQCRVEEALPLAARALDLWERTLGPAHPDRARAIRTQATLLRRCGRSAEAARLEADAGATARR